jgi:hypothetical protein
VTIDATVSGPAANSYLTVADADARAATDLGRDLAAWYAADEPTKEAALIRATVDLDTFKRSPAESKYAPAQARRFPRSTDVSGGVSFLPVLLLDATWAQAKYRLDNADAFVDARSRRARGYSSFSGDDGGATMSLHTELEPVSVEAQMLMDDVLGTMGVAGRRPGFRSIQASSTSDADEASASEVIW